MRRAGLAVLAWLALAATAWAQTVYNPRVMEFDSPDHDTKVGSYTVEFWLQGVDPAVGKPVSSYTLAKDKVTTTGDPLHPYRANLVDLTPVPAIPIGSTYVARMIAVGLDPLQVSGRSDPSNSFRLSGCAPFSGQSASQMTLVVGPPPVMVTGALALLDVTITGPSPVHSVTIDLLADGGPAWYFVLPDARASVPYTIGPFRRKGRSELTVRAVDELGCEVSNGVRIFVTVQ